MTKRYSAFITVIVSTLLCITYLRQEDLDGSICVFYRAAVLQVLRGKTSESGPKLARSLAHIRPKYNNPLGPIHMSSVAGLVQLPGGNLLSVHMKNFSPVDRDENLRS